MRHQQKVLPYNRKYLLSVMTAVALVCAGEVPAVAAVSAESDLYEQALVATQDRQYGDARVHLQNLLDANPSYLPARILLGEVLLALGDAQGAEGQLLQALGAGGDPRLIVVALGQAELLQGKTTELLNDIDIQTDLPALKADISNLKGYAYLEKGQLTEARAAFMEAASLQPSNPTPYVGLARAALVENLPAAADYAEQAFERGANGAVWRLRGDIAAARGDNEAAIAAYRHAIDLAWGDLDARTARATLLINMDRPDEAQADLDAVREIIPDDLEAVYLSAIILANGGKTAEAMDLLAQAQRSMERVIPSAMSDNRTTIRMAGLISYALGDFETAARHFDRLVAISPTDDNALVLVARARAQLGEFATAIDHLETAVTIDRENPTTRGLLGLVYMLRGELDLAQDQLSLAAASRDVPGSLLVQGIGLLQMNKPDAAMDAFARARDRHSTDDLAATLLPAIGAMEQQDFATAITWARRAAELAPDSAYIRHITALALINAGQDDEARKELDAALKLDKSYVPAMLDRARLMTRTGNLPAARTAYRTILKTDRNYPAAMLELADLERLDGRQGEAENLLRTAREENPGLEGVWTHSVAFHAAQGRLDEAVALTREFVNRNPDAIAIRNLMAVLLWRANRHEEAMAQYQDMVEISLDRAAILYRIGLVQEDMKRYGDAIASFRRALAWLPDNGTIWRKLIILEARTGDLTEATRLLEEYRPRATQEDIQTLTGQLYLAAGSFRESLAAFQAADHVAADSATVATGMYNALLGLGRRDAAMAHLDQWLDNNRNDDVQTTLALAYANAGLVNEAIGLQLDTLSRHPRSVPVLNNLALLYLQAGDAATALDYASRARELEPYHPAVLDTVGWIMVNAGQAGEGLAILREAQARAGGNARVHYHMAVALNRLGRDNEARGELQSALEGADAFPEREDAERLLSELSEN